MIKAKFTSFLFYLFVFTTVAQESVFVKALENGNGLLKTLNNECYVIAPSHIVSEYLGDISVIAKNRIKQLGKLEESFEPDLSVIHLQQNGNQICKSYRKTEEIIGILNQVSSGYIEYIDELGEVNRVQTYISSYNQESISIIPRKNDIEFYKGMSGSAFYVEYKNEKILMGMLMQLESDLKTGYVYQIDDIERVLKPFFDSSIAKRKKLGVFILKEGSRYVDFSNQFLSNLQVNNRYETINQIPNSEFLRKQFYSIVAGRIIESAIPKKIKEDIDELVLGTVSMSSEQNQKNMYIVWTSIEANLYSTDDFNLIKSLNTSGKGLNSNFNIAKNQSIKSLLTKLENQLK